MPTYPSCLRSTTKVTGRQMRVRILPWVPFYLSVGQSGRPPALGAGLRGFKSCRSDQFVERAPEHWLSETLGSTPRPRKGFADVRLYVRSTNLADTQGVSPALNRVRWVQVLRPQPNSMGPWRNGYAGGCNPSHGSSILPGSSNLLP